MRPVRARWAVLLGLLLAGPLAAAPTTWPTSRTLTYAELALLSREPLKITAPVLRLVTGAPTEKWRGWLGAAHIWADLGGGWREVGLTSAIAQTAPNDRPGEMLILLEGAPHAVRVGLTGYYTGPFTVDHVEIILPDGTRLAPEEVVGANGVDHPEQAMGEDGKLATIGHTAPPRPGLPTPVAGLDFRFGIPRRIMRQERPVVPLQPARYGVYNNAGNDSDPHHNTAGHVWQCDPADVAFYDFTVPQWNAPELFAKVRRLNPKHRFVARLTWPAINPLDYAFDEGTRAKVAAAIREQLQRGTDLLDGVYLGDEEPAHYLAGWFNGEAPDWARRYSARYEAETGRKFDWHAPALRNWILDKGRRLWSDLYAQIKAVDPKLKVMPFLYIPGDLSGWGVWEPSTIKADGWVNQWYDGGPDRPLAVPCTHADAKIRSVWVQESWFSLAVARLRQAGVSLDDLYCQVWAFQTTDDAIAQIEHARLAGVTNFFVFYYCAWFPTPPPAGPAPLDAAFRLMATGDPTPCLAQEATTHDTAVGLGLAQSFIAPKDSLASVGLRCRAERACDDYTVAVAPDADGLPAPQPLASAPLSVKAGTNGWVTVPLTAKLEVGRRYHLVLRPRSPDLPGLRQGPRPPIDDQGLLRIAVSVRDPYAGGDLVAWERYGGYFDAWRPPHGGYPTENLRSWSASARQRRELENYITLMRALGR